MTAMPLVRLAMLEVDPSHLEAFLSAVKEQMDVSVRTEPGVLTIYAVAEKDIPSRLRFFEIYADEDAYSAHLASPHFRTFRATTDAMVRSRVLTETIPIQLSAKSERETTL